MGTAGPLYQQKISCWCNKLYYYAFTQLCSIKNSPLDSAYNLPCSLVKEIGLSSTVYLAKNFISVSVLLPGINNASWFIKITLILEAKYTLIMQN